MTVLDIKEYLGHKAAYTQDGFTTEGIIVSIHHEESTVLQHGKIVDVVEDYFILQDIKGNKHIITDADEWMIV